METIANKIDDYSRKYSVEESIKFLKESHFELCVSGYSYMVRFVTDDEVLSSLCEFDVKHIRLKNIK